MPTELEVQIRQTKAFIDTRPVTLVLQPHDRLSDGKGGRKLVATASPRQPQVMRFIETAESALRAVTVEGEQRTQYAMLMGLPDAQLEVNDTFEWGGKTWRVEDVLFPNNYSKRATVVEHGR